MFGWTLIKTRILNFERGINVFTEAELELLERENEYLQEEFDRLLVENEEIKEENKRLFDMHNKKLTKPRRDKNGDTRNPDGTYAEVTA